MRAWAVMLAILLVPIVPVFASEKGELSNFLDFGLPLALLVTYSIVALGFMASRLFESREMETWSRIELREAFISTLYAGLVVTFIPVFGVLIDSFTVQSDKTYVQMFDKVILTAFNNLISFSLLLAQIGFLNGISWNPTASIGIPLVINQNFSIYFTPQSVYSLVYVFAGMFGPLLISAIFSVAGQFMLLQFLEKTIYVFLGLALFLRAFTFTRRMGSTLFAIFLGGFLFLKLALVIEASIFTTMSEMSQKGGGGNIFDATTFGNIPSVIGHFFTLLIIPKYIIDFCLFLDETCQELSSPWEYICRYVVWTHCWYLWVYVWVFDMIATTINLVLQVVFTAKTLIEVMILGPGGIGLQLADDISSQIAKNSDIMAFAFFIPFFNIVFVLTGIIALVQAFGGDESVASMLTFI